jgi:nitrite reductase (NADH) large subunit
VCEDALGLAAELEADMQRVVESYQCEWKTAINDPQTLRRFRHFVNSERPDERVLFVSQRGQRRPARPEERTPAAAGEPALESA